MLKVFMLPTPNEAIGDTTNAINQIVLKLAKHLPAHGVEVINHEAGADLIVGHAGQTGGVGRVDVAHCHGLYPTAIEPSIGWHFAANRSVSNNLIAARAVTVPSQWVADILARDMHIQASVIGWAIDADQWEQGSPQGYVLWNKTRIDGVCNPRPLEMLAEKAPDVQFVSTFGRGFNIRESGRVPYEQMQDMVKGASVYLATTKETFGIGTLEAMAAGVPILGFKHGATAQIVEHGVTGFLAEPNDYEGLLKGLRYCLEHRAVLGANARKVALDYSWDKVASQFADLYKRVYADKQAQAVAPKVSVVIPCYNYARFVSEAIKSVSEQTGVSFELIVVNDGSTDNSREVIEQHLGMLQAIDFKATLYDIPNGGVSRARNYGIDRAKGEYIVCLDADDKLGNPEFLSTLAAALDADSELGIAFTGIRMMTEAGELGNETTWPKGYDFDQQVAGHNQVPTCCMFRRIAWERAGGYRTRYTPAEDAGLWLSIGALGYKGRHVVESGWFVYRMHGNSLSTPVRTGQAVEPNWRDRQWITDGGRPCASDGYTRMLSWPVRNYDTPKVSIIVPVAAYHLNYLIDAIDSIESQTDRSWELIIVNDSHLEIDTSPFPFARVIDTGGGKGAAVARNMGIKAATAPLVTFLDADDMLHSRFLELTLRAYAATGRYIYTDWISQTLDGRIETNETPEYNSADVFKRTSIHSINILIPRDVLLECGGFDEKMPSWEDVELFMNLADRGFCGKRVPHPLVMYRYTTGQLRERGEQIKDTLVQYLRSRYRDYIVEDKPVCSCMNKPKVTDGVPAFTSEMVAAGASQLVRVEYHGAAGMHTVIGPVTSQNYGRHEAGDIFYVYAADQQNDPALFVPIYDSFQDAQETAIPAAPKELQ